jgi:hypothetical protein
LCVGAGGARTRAGAAPPPPPPRSARAPPAPPPPSLGRPRAGVTAARPRARRSQVRFEEFWAEAKLVKDALLSKSGEELEGLLRKLYDYEPA